MFWFLFWVVVVGIVYTVMVVGVIDALCMDDWHWAIAIFGGAFWPALFVFMVLGWAGEQVSEFLLEYVL